MPVFDDAAIAAIHAAAARRDRVYPHAVWAPIPEAVRQPSIDVTTVIYHSMAGPNLTSLEALRAYIARDDVEIEPTFVGPDFAGRIFQVVHWDQRADCNYRANPFAVSCETQDRGSATLPTTPWSAAQIEQLAGIAAFAFLRDGVPLRLPPRWDAGGVGFHSQHAEWSKYTGKTCPGAARIAQMPAVLARAIEIVNWQPDPDEEDDEMNRAIAAVYAPSKAVTVPNAKTFALLPDGSVRHATGPDVAYAKAAGATEHPIEGDEHYKQLDHLSLVNEPDA